MFASDKNVELVSKLVLDSQRLLELRLQHFKIDSVSRFTQLLAALAVAFFVVLFLFLGLVVGSIAIFIWLSNTMGAAGAFLIVTGFYLLLSLGVIVFRRVLVLQPLSRIIGEILLDDDPMKPTSPTV